MSTIFDSAFELLEEYTEFVVKRSEYNDQVDFKNTQYSESYLDQAINESYLYTENDYSF